MPGVPEKIISALHLEVCQHQAKNPAPSALPVYLEDGLAICFTGSQYSQSQ